MKKLIILLSTVLLTGCYDNFVERKFPEIYDDLKNACPSLQQVDPATNKYILVSEARNDVEKHTPKKNEYKIGQDVSDKSWLKDAGKKPTVKSDLKNLGRFLTGKKETNESKRPEQDNVPFAPPYDKARDDVVTDKSGAKHTPMSRAKDLARTAMKRIKTEMLGKAPGNN